MSSPGRRPSPAGTQTHFLYDGLGSTVNLADGNGNSVASYSYDIFGAIRAQTGTSGNYWQFTGEQLDGDSGLYYLRARYYDPFLGRFLSRDPAGAGHPYVYVRNNPIIYTDPYGLDACSTVTGVASKVFGGKKKNCKETVQAVGSAIEDAASAGADAYGPPYDLIKVTQILDTLPLGLACVSAVVGAGVGVAICVTAVATIELVAGATTFYQILTSDCSNLDKFSLSGLNALNIAAGDTPIWFQGPFEVYAYSATDRTLKQCESAGSAFLSNFAGVPPRSGKE